MQFNSKTIALGLVSGMLVMASCQPKVKVTTASLLGTWKAQEILHPMIEKDYKMRMQVIDTMTTLELGQVALWQTNDVNKVKAEEKKMVEDEYKNMKANMLKSQYVFINDSLLLKGNEQFQDSCRYQLVGDNRMMIQSIRHSGGRKDTVTVAELTTNKLVIEEPFMKEKIVATFVK